MNSPTQPQTGAAGTLVAIVATMNVESPKLVLALLPYCARSRLLQCLRIHLGLQKLSLQIYLSSNHYTQFGSGCDHKHTRRSWHFIWNYSTVDSTMEMSQNV